MKVLPGFSLDYLAHYYAYLVDNPRVAMAFTVLEEDQKKVWVSRYKGTRKERLILRHHNKSRNQQVSETTDDDKLKTIFPQKEIPLDAELITTTIDGQVKSSSVRSEDEEKQQGETTNEVKSSSDRSEDEEKQQGETTNEEKESIAVEHQGSPITGDQEQYLEKTGPRSSVDEEEEGRFQDAAHVKLTVEPHDKEEQQTTGYQDAAPATTTKDVIMIPHNTASHHTLYVLNKYENRLDILDSLDYKKCIKKTWRHQHRSCKELIERMYVLLRRHYGERALKADDEPNWGQLAARPRKVNTPKQRDAQCGQFMVQFAKYWNGQSLAKDDDELRLPRFKRVHEVVHGREMETKRKGNWQVNVFEEMPMVNKGESAYVALKLALLYNGIKFFEEIDNFDDDLEIWKAETLYILLLSEVNEVNLMRWVKRF
ncbi:hypothetical protein D1007_58144 [Hordeum vulgare]|nr:hypothetical protein D1007_58144 [Hordeum vulgare]